MVRAQAALGRGYPLLRRGRLTTPTHLRASVLEGQTGNGERRAALRFSWRPAEGRAPGGLRQKREPTNTGTDKRRNRQERSTRNPGADKCREHTNAGTCKRRDTQTPEHANAGTDKNEARETREKTNAGAHKHRDMQTPERTNAGTCKRREHAGIAAPAKNRGKKLAVRPFFVSLFTKQTNKKSFSL